MNGTQGLIADLYETRVRLAQAVHHLTVLERERIAMKQAQYDALRQGGKSQKDSEEAQRVIPEYVAHLATISGQEHARDLLAAECERLALTVKLDIATLNSTQAVAA